MEIIMPPESELEQLDKRIRLYASQAKSADPKFIEAELRRFVNKALLYQYDNFFGDERWIPDDAYLMHYREKLEQEFQCYFEREKFAEERNPSSHFSWKSIYGASSAQVEGFAVDEGLNEVLPLLNFGKKGNVVKRRKFSSKKGKKPSRALYYFLIQNGYLFPQGEKRAVVHTNLLNAYTGILPNSGDSHFLTRDLGRCPYHSNSHHEPLTAEESWEYWKDLVALAMSPLYSEILYLPRHFKGEEHHRDSVQPCLELGRKLVPQRYVELEAKIEDFAWIIPSH